MAEQGSATLYSRLTKGMSLMEDMERRGETDSAEYERYLATFTKLDKEYGEACDREGQATQMEIPI